RAAIQEANFAASDDTINFSLPANSTINLLTALPAIDGNVVINGPGANTLTVQRSTAGGTPNFRVFAINAGRTVSISGMTISNGSMVNAAGNEGAGIFNQGTLTLTACAVTGNTTPRSGGGVRNTGTMTVTGCTISGNNADSAGSGVSNIGTLTIINSTISSNVTDGLSNSSPGVATLVNDTFSGNTVRGISNNGGATVNIGNTIVGNTPGGAADVSGAFNSSGNNVIGNASGSTGFTNGVNGDKVGATGAVLDPRVGPLANNGGTTQTNALLSGSPALDGGNNTLATNNSLTTDQRGAGFGRFIDAADADAIAQVDIGAFEAQPSIEDITDKSTNEDTALPSFNFTVADGGVSNFTVTATSSNTTLVPNGNINVGGAGSTRSLSITPAANQNGTTTISVTAAGTIGATAVSMTDTFVLTVNAVNDAPAFALAAGPIVNEDSGPQIIANQAVNINAGPANESGQTVAFTVSNNNNGLFSVQPAISPTGTLTFTSAPDANGSATVSVTLKDNGGTANGGSDTSATQQFTITVNAVNDAPVNTVPGTTQQVTENSTLTFSTANANAISIGDIDAGGGAMRETLTATNGTITLGSTAGLAFTVGNGTANSTMTFTGTIAAVNTALQGMTFTPTSGFSGAATLTIVTNDQGNTGSGGALSDTDVVNINVNDGGTLQLSAATYTVGENSGPAVITITRTGGNAGTATVKIDTSNGTATAGSDYTAVSQTVTFNNGETSKTVNISIADDLLNEPDETVNITLSNAGGSGALGTPATAVLTISNDDPAGGYIKFSTANYNVNEGGIATITVQRTGTLTQAVTIDFATSDNSDPASFVPCAPTPGNTLATSRCDFDSAFGRISFAAGDGADKTFTVMTQQDNYVEGPETLTLTLSNPTGGAGILGLPTATLTINDDASEPAANPVDDTNNFVESLYRDFLNRPSDASGKAFWVSNIDKCNSAATRPPNMTQAECIAAFRVSTAQAFFLSGEYQQTGGTAYLTNKVAFGSLPNFIRFETDAQMLGKGYVFGAPGADAVLEANKVAYFNDYVSRTEFVNTYGAVSNQQYVETLTQNTGVTWGVGEKQQLVDGLNNATETRATVLRKITEKPDFRNAERETMFVLTEYFGFLRRNPDQSGFNFWLNKLHSANGNAMQAEMVRAFIESPEYRQRFGQ
ncbi:MAG TPA: Calx-beta domain-containing protein, partial [Pyrinomonadaceae bacterium]|nr:Calx-beta domain-containing protein [Pyrinomonadaceae bacterium]